MILPALIQTFQKITALFEQNTIVVGVEAWVATPEDMIVYKMIAARPRDLNDVDEIIQAQKVIQRKLDWAYIERWATEWGVQEALSRFQKN